MLSEYRDAFNLFDKDADGLITCGELGTVMRSLGQSPSNEELDRVTSLIDQEGDGNLCFLDLFMFMFMFFLCVRLFVCMFSGFARHL